jgi:hypothetical protein
MLEENGHLYWDISALWADILAAVRRRSQPSSDSVHLRRLMGR